MRVAVVSSYFPTSTNPWEGRSAYETLRILSRRCELRVFCPVATYPSLLRRGRRSVPQPDLHWTPQGVAATYIPYPALPLVSRPFNGWVMGRRLLPVVRGFKPDILLNYMVYPDGYAAVRIGRALGVPVVLTAIGSDLNRMSDAVCAALTRYALRSADFVTTVSRHLARTAEALGSSPENTKLLLNGCDTTVFRPQDRALARQELSLGLSSEICVYVGRYDVRKGLIELIDAIVALRSNRPTLSCYIIGKGPDESLLRQAIKRSHASPYITLVPPCGSMEIATWMAAANMIALPSYAEGCPNVIIEALAAGRPVVATNVGGIPELMDDSCGQLVPPKSVPLLAQALAQVLDGKWNSDSIAAEHNRNWNDVADDLYKIFQNLVDPKHPNRSL